MQSKVAQGAMLLADLGIFGSRYTRPQHTIRIFLEMGIKGVDGGLPLSMR